MSFILYADGSCLGNPGPGAWAWLLLDGDTVVVEKADGNPTTTNNQMELQAAISCFAWLHSSSLTPGFIAMRLDSQYVLKGLFEWMDGWKAKGWKKVKNLELWQELDGLHQDLLRKGWSFAPEWVKGHADDAYNNRVDVLANTTATKLQQSLRGETTTATVAPEPETAPEEVRHPAEPEFDDRPLSIASDLLVIARVGSMTPEIFLSILQEKKHLL